MPVFPAGKRLVLLAEDLRLEDNLAYATAAKSASGGLAVVRVLPEARGRPLRTPHLRQLEEAAEDRLRRRLDELGITFEVLVH